MDWYFHRNRKWVLGVHEDFGKDGCYAVQFFLSFILHGKQRGHRSILERGTNFEGDTARFISRNVRNCSCVPKSRG